MLRRSFYKLIALMFLTILLNTTTFADLEITVHTSEGWGTGPTSKIKELCKNIDLNFQYYLRDEHKLDEINVNVRYDSNGPFIEHNISKPLVHDISLSATTPNWEQITYQFGHEFCHILHKHQITTKNNPNLWFQESICMMASIWVLKRMGVTWEYLAPYPDWVDYRHNLTNYAISNMERPEVQYAGTAAEWLDEWEQFLRDDYKNSFSHHLTVAQLSYNFLPIFEENPEAWNAVRQMPASKGKISEYMQDWYENVDIQDKQFVEAIAREMGISVKNRELSELNVSSSLYTNLTFFYKSENSIIPINKPHEWNGYPPIGTWEKTPDGKLDTKAANDNFDEMHEFSNWIYSHAPATIVYDISEIKSTSFGAYFLLPHPACGGAASMDFTAIADGVELYSEDFYLDDYGSYIEFEIPNKTQILTIEIGDLGNQGCDHFVLGEPRIYHNNSVSTVSQNDIDADINDDGYVDLSDVLIVRSAIQNKNSYNTDINGDGITNEIDVLIVKAKAHEAIVAAAPRKIRLKLTTWANLKNRK